MIFALISTQCRTMWLNKMTEIERFFLAAKNGDLETVRYCIEKLHIDPTTKNEYEDATVLHFAAINGHLHIAQYLLENYNINLYTEGGFFIKETPLFFAAINGHFELVKCFIRYHLKKAEGSSLAPYQPSRRDFATKTLPEVGFKANKTEHIKIFNYIIQNYKVSPETQNDENFTDLHQAAFTGDFELVQQLLQEDTPYNKSTLYGITPIDCAAGNGHLKALREFLTAIKNNPDIQNSIKRTPLHYAAENGQHHIVKELIEKYNADPYLYDIHKFMPIHYAIMNGHLEIVQYFIENEYFAPSDQQHMYFSMDLIHYSARYGQLEILHYLIAQGVDPNLSSSSVPPICHATQAGHLHIVKELIETYRVDPEYSEKKDTRKPLHLAAEHKHLDILRYLVEVHKVPVKENLPHDLAIMHNQYHIIEYLARKDIIKLENILTAMKYNITFFENRRLLFSFLELIEKIESRKIRNQCQRYLARQLIYNPTALSSLVHYNWNLTKSIYGLNKKELTQKQKDDIVIQFLRKALVLSKRKKILSRERRKDLFNNFANTYLAFRVVAGLSVKGQSLPDDCARHIMGYARYFCNKTPKDKRVIKKLYAMKKANKTRTKGEENFYDKIGESKQKRRKI